MFWCKLHWFLPPTLWDGRISPYSPSPGCQSPEYKPHRGCVSTSCDTTAHKKSNKSQYFSLPFPSSQYVCLDLFKEFVCSCSLLSRVASLSMQFISFFWHITAFKCFCALMSFCLVCLQTNAHLSESAEAHDSIYVQNRLCVCISMHVCTFLCTRPHKRACAKPSAESIACCDLHIHTHIWFSSACLPHTQFGRPMKDWCWFK